MKRAILKRQSNQKGFSLIEVIVTVFLFLLISASLYMSATAGQRSWQVNAARVRRQQELRQAAESIKQDLMQAVSLRNEDGPFDPEAGEVDEENNHWWSILVFQVPVQDVSQDAASGFSQDIQLEVDPSTNTFLRKQAGTTRVLAQNIESVGFRRLEENFLRVKITPFDDLFLEELDDNVLQFQIKLRN